MAGCPLHIALYVIFCTSLCDLGKDTIASLISTSCCGLANITIQRKTSKQRPGEAAPHNLFSSSVCYESYRLIKWVHHTSSHLDCRVDSGL